MRNPTSTRSICECVGFRGLQPNLQWQLQPEQQPIEEKSSIELAIAQIPPQST